MKRKHPVNNIYDIIEDWNIIVASIKATYGDIDIANTRARDFLNIYLPNIDNDTTFGNIIRIMTSNIKDLTEKEKQLRRERIRKLNKDKKVRSADDFNAFARLAFGKKGGTQ